MEPSETIGQRIRQVRGELSQKAFGARIGLSQTAVTALESGQSEPRLGTFNSIVEAFGLSPEWLRTGKMPEPANVEEVAAPYTAAPSPIQSPAADVVAAFLSQMAERDEAHRKQLKDVRREYQTMMQAQASQWQWAYDDMAKQRNEALAKVEWYEVLLGYRVPTAEQDLQLQKMRHNTPEAKPVQVKGLKSYDEVPQPQGEEVEMTHELGGMAQDFNWQQLSSRRQAPAEESALRLADAA